MSLPSSIIKAAFTYKTVDYLTYTIPRSQIAAFDIVAAAPPTETLQSYYNRALTKPDLLSNGGFFGGADPCFNLIIDKAAKSTSTLYQWGFGILENNTILYNSLSILKSNAALKHFISGYPVFVDNYAAVPINFAQEVDYPAERTVLGFNATDIFLIYFSTCRFADVQYILTHQFPIQYGINLDGGGSSRCLEDGSQSFGSSWSRPINNFISIKMKPLPESKPTLPSPTTPIYILSAAFQSENEAITLQKQFTTLGFKNISIQKADLI